MSEELRNLESFYAEADALEAYADANPKVADLLYRCDLLPEQVERGTKDWGRCLIIVGYLKELLEKPDA